MAKKEKKKDGQRTGTVADSKQGVASRHFIETLISLHVDHRIVRLVEETAREMDDGRSPENPHVDSRE